MHIVAVDLELLACGHRHDTVLVYDVLACWWAGHNTQLEQCIQGMQQPELLLGGLFLCQWDRVVHHIAQEQ